MCLTDLGTDRGAINLDTEVLLAVFGRAGNQPFYKRDLVVSIGFVILDRSSLAVRVAGVRALLDISDVLLMR